MRRFAPLLALLAAVPSAVADDEPVATVDLAWRAGPSPSLDRPGGAVAVASSGALYVLGGVGEAATAVEKFVPSADGGTWSDEPAMPTGRESAVVAEVGGDLYVIGGTRPSHGGQDDHATAQIANVERYRTKERRWETLPSLHVARDVASVAVFEGRIFVVGGFLDKESIDSTEVFDPEHADQGWTLLPSKMPVPVRSAAYATVGGKLFVIGGCSGYGREPCRQRRVQVYDLASDAWAVLDESNWMPTGRHFSGQGAVAIGSRIVVFGGATDFSKTIYARVEILDTATGTWSVGTPMPTGRKSTACALLGDVLYVVGGHSTTPAPGRPPRGGRVVELVDLSKLRGS